MGESWMMMIRSCSGFVDTETDMVEVVDVRSLRIVRKGIEKQCCLIWALLVGVVYESP